MSRKLFVKKIDQLILLISSSKLKKNIQDIIRNEGEESKLRFWRRFAKLYRRKKFNVKMKLRNP